MKALIPYLLFNGNCREAMNFYRDCFGGELKMMTFKEAPPGNECNNKANPNAIMHSALQTNAFTLMASDWPGDGAVFGNNISINIECESLAEIEKLFQALSHGGITKQALSNTFWGARFGMLIDKFGIHWMLNYLLE
jgi:PhnB protein